MTIEPVAWMSDDGRPFKTESEARRHSWNSASPLYDERALVALNLEAEVEALRKDAERYRKLCVVIDENAVSEDILGSIIDDALHLGSGALTRSLDKDFDGYFPGIDATMQE